MILRVLVAVAVVTCFLVACGPSKPLTEQEICGPQGCDGCVGAACPSADGGNP